MGIQVSETLYDDYTKEPGDDIEQFSIILDGMKYTLDASRETRDKIRNALCPFISVAHSKEVDSSGDDPAVIREWARGHGYSVTNHGRVPLRVIAAYHESVR